MRSFADRLDELVAEFAGGNKAEFARFCGIQDSSVRQYLAGTKPTLDNLVAIARATKYSLDWLVGSGVEQFANTEPQNYTTAQPIGSETVSVPKLTFRASAGRGSIVSQGNPGVLHFPRLILDHIGLRPEHAGAMEIAGDSMKPTIQDGDLVLMDVSAKEIRDGKVFAFSVGEDAFVKRLRRSRSKLIMYSDNKDDFPEEVVPPSEFLSIFGMVKWTGRSL